MEAKVSLYVAANNTWAPGDCPHGYLQACRAAMPLKPPNPQTTTLLKRNIFDVVVGWVVLGALQPCMLANTHADSPQEPMKYETWVQRFTTVTCQVHSA